MAAGQWPLADERPSIGDREFISLSDITGFLRRYIFSIAGWAVVGVLGAGSYLATTDPVFTARAQVLIEPKLPQLLQQQGAEVNLSLDTAQVESQIAVLKSEKIARMVIEKLNLREDAEFNRPRTPPMRQRIERLRRIVANALGIGTDMPAAGRAGNAASELSEFERDRLTMWSFQSGLDIRRVGVSYAIDISFSSLDPELAAEVANATAEAFVREQVESKAQSAREGGKWLETRLGELRTQMNKATQVVQEFRARHDYEVRGRGASIVDGKVVFEEQDPDNGPTLEEMEVTADTYRKMYESFLQAYTNSVSRQSYPVADARVITAASRPLSASHPRKKLVLVFGVLAGIMAGVGLSFLRFSLDRTVRSPRQVIDELGVDCIGELPPAKRRLAGLELARSRYGESLRKVMTSVALADTIRPVRCLGVSSASAGKSKSALAANLATLYSASGMRTLVIDADSLHSAGWLIRGAGPAVHPASTDHIPLDIVPAANGLFDILPGPDSDSRKLLTPKNLQAAISEQQDYDMIIVDFPPLPSGAEWLVASSQLDGVILVAERGKTSMDALKELVRLMRASKTTLIGVLMTNVRLVSQESRYRLF